MGIRQRRYSKEELARRGQELYESGVRQQVEAGNEGRIVAIDIETGAFEVDENVVPVTNRLFERFPDAQPWIIRIGHRAVYHFGTRSLKKNLCTSGLFMDQQPRIILNPDILVGKPIIRGTRLAVEFIIDLLAQGWSTDEILRNYPGICLEDIQACLSYASAVLKAEKVYALPV